MTKTILLTGATGFLGSHLLKSLINKGFHVSILKRSFSDTSRIHELLDRVDSFDIDKVDIEEPFRKYGKIDAVIHTATKYGRKEEKISEIVDANLYFPLKLLETAISFNTDVFFNTDTSLDKYLNFYSLSKKQLVEWLKQISIKLKVFNLKFEHIYGPGDDSSKFISFVAESLLKRVEDIKLTSGEQKRDFIFVEDAVSVYLMLIELYPSLEDGFNEYEVGSGKSIRIQDLVINIKELVGNSETKLLFGAIPYRENEVMLSQADISKLVTLGWKPNYSLEEGLIETIKWHREKFQKG